jgi:hypothetical protein
VQSGHGWEGIVKNRCKNGDYYWVHAHVTPTREGDEIVGYTSAGSIIAFCLYHEDLRPGDHGVICSFGAGYSIGSLVLEKL